MIDDDDQEIDRLVDQAVGCFERGDYDGAIVVLEAALALDPDEALLHAWLAMCLAERRFVEAARAEAELALALDPTEAFVFQALAQVAMLDGKRHEARQHIETAIGLDEHDPDLYVSLWRIKRSLGDAGAEELEIARELDPESLDVLVAWSEYERMRGNVYEAERYAREALESNAESTDALLAMGWVLLESGRLAEAHEHVVLALRANPTDGEALSLLIGIKARRNWFLGLWYRWNTRMVQLGERKYIGVLLATYLVYRLAVLLLRDLDLGDIAEIISYVWLAIIAYSWIAPMIFDRMLRREIDELELDPDY